MSTVRSHKMMGELTNEKQKHINAEKRLVVDTELAGLLSRQGEQFPRSMVNI
jgi:ribosomal protein L31E